MTYETILSLIPAKAASGLITINRPQALNALNSTVVAEINTALDGFENDAAIGCIVITGFAGRPLLRAPISRRCRI